MSPTRKPVDGARVPTASSSPAPVAARTTTSSFSSMRTEAPSTPTSCDGVADGLVEHVVGIELAGELSPGPCKPLRQSPGAALSLVELASLQGAARRAGHPLGQRKLLVVEHLFGLVEDEDEPDAATRRLR